MDKKEISELKKYDDFYYRGIPLISDTEYDKLRSEIMEKYPNDLYFTQVGSIIRENKVEVPYILGSLDKYKIDTVEKWLNTFSKDEDFIITPKLDGSGIYLEFKDGKIKFAGSRGQYEPGDTHSKSKDITSKAKELKLKSIKKEEFHIRGECMLEGDSYIDLNVKNRRNGVSGIMMRDEDDNTGLNKVKIYCHELLYPELDTEEERIKFITDAGLYFPDYIKIQRKDISVEFLVKLLKSFKEKLNHIDIDGIVLTPNSYKRENVHRPTNKASFKVNEDGIEAEVDYIEWNTSRTGRVIPTVILKTPIDINGSSIQRISGFNAKYIRDESIGKGSLVSVVKSGDIIPYITEVIKTSKCSLPNKCSLCDSELEKSGVDLICVNDNCENKYVQIEYYLKCMKVENIGLPSLKALKINSLDRLYTITKDDILSKEGFQESKTNTILSEIKNSLYTRQYRVIAGLGLRNIGIKTSKLICEKYSINELYDLTVEDLIKFEGIAEKTATYFIEDINKNKPIIDKLFKYGLKFKKDKIINTTESIISGKGFILTGKGDKPRKQVTDEIKSKGGVITSITKCDYLVCADTNSTSSKMKKAKELNKNIITYQELDRMLMIP